MASHNLPEQIVLDVHLPDAQTFLNFETGQNGLLVDHLQRTLSMPLNPNQPFLSYISGSSGVGKSHLLVSICHQAQAQELEHFYINLDQSLTYPSQILEGLENLDVVCIDNIQWIQNNEDWQRALFDLINRVKERANCRLFLTANAGAKSLDVQLADLSSRLTWGISFHLVPLDESDAATALLNKAKQKGIVIALESLQFLVHHCRRDMHTLTQTLDKVEHQSLQEKRKISIPFIKQVLGI